VREGSSIVEVATFRADGQYSDGRRPDSVRFTSAREDAQRRDFTINGLFYDPIDRRLIDWVGGEADLANRVLRAIGDPAARFAEDHLRLLRAIRFAARFDLHIEPVTAAAIDQAAPLLISVSPERIADELRRMLTPPTRARAWPLLWQHRLAPLMFRYLPPPVPANAELDRSILLAVRPGEAVTFALALAAAVIDAQAEGKQLADVRPLLDKRSVHKSVHAMRTALKLSNDETDAMAAILLGCGPLLADEPPRVAVMKRFLAHPTSEDSRRLLEAMAARGWCANRVARLRVDLEALEKSEFAPTPLVSGDDLTAAGMQPGPVFKGLLDRLYDEQLEGRLASKQQGVAMALEWASRFDTHNNRSDKSDPT